MWRLVLAAMAGVPGFAVAADLPVGQAPRSSPATAPGPYWTGLYLGAQAGRKWGEDDYEVGGHGPPLHFDPSFDLYGWFAGGHLGARHQWGWLVAGVEGDLEWADVDGEFAAGNGDEVGTDIDWEGSVRGTLGVGTGRFHLYGTGGIALAGSENRIFDELPAPTHEAEEDTRIGWTVGVGMDVAVTRVVSAGILYKYVDLGEEDFRSDVFPLDTFTSDVKHHSVQGRVTVNW